MLKNASSAETRLKKKTPASIRFVLDAVVGNVICVSSLIMSDLIVARTFLQPGKI
jgi:uncharacterized membrane protein